MVLMQQHIVNITSPAAEEIYPICFTLFSAKILPGLANVDSPSRPSFRCFGEI